MRSGRILGTFYLRAIGRIALSLKLLIIIFGSRCCCWVILVKCVKSSYICCGAIRFEKSLDSFTIGHDSLMATDAGNLQILDLLGCNTNQIVIKVGLYTFRLSFKSILRVYLAFLENARTLLFDLSSR